MAYNTGNESVTVSVHVENTEVIVPTASVQGLRAKAKKKKKRKRRLVMMLIYAAN